MTAVVAWDCAKTREGRRRKTAKRMDSRRLIEDSFRRSLDEWNGSGDYTTAKLRRRMTLPKVSLTTKIFIGLILGVLLGWLKPEWGTAVRPLSLLFLNLIKSIIAPLIFSTLVIGIAGTGDIRQVGRIGVKSLLYFEIVTTFALIIGLVAVNLTKPGVGVSLSGVARPVDKSVLADQARKLADEANAAATRGDAATAASKAAQAADAVSKGLTAPDPPAKPQEFGDIIQHLAPSSILKAMADGDVLQIVEIGRAHV